MPDYSVKLKEAMAEIAAVLKKHDIAAHVLLHEPGFSEFLMRIDPTWSMMRFEESQPEGLQIRFRSTLSQFDGDKAAQKRAIEDSVNMVVHFREVLRRDAELMMGLEAMLREHFAIEETDGVWTPHREH